MSMLSGILEDLTDIVKGHGKNIGTLIETAKSQQEKIYKLEIQVLELQQQIKKEDTIESLCKSFTSKS